MSSQEKRSNDPGWRNMSERGSITQPSASIETMRCLLPERHLSFPSKECLLSTMCDLRLNKCISALLYEHVHVSSMLCHRKRIQSHSNYCKWHVHVEPRLNKKQYFFLFNSRGGIKGFEGFLMCPRMCMFVPVKYSWHVFSSKKGGFQKWRCWIICWIPF